MQIENAIKDEFVTEYIPDEFQVKSFYLPEPLVKHEVGELTETVTRSEERSQFVFSTCGDAAQDLQRRYVIGSFVVQVISFRPTFLTAIESNIIRDSTSSRSSGFGYLCD